MESLRIQGRDLYPKDIAKIRELINNKKGWHRTQISRELCKKWGWYGPNRQIKDMACRTMLLKLERKGYITLPKRLTSNGNSKSRSIASPDLFHQTSIECELSDVLPLQVAIVQTNEQREVFESLLHHYHYLSYQRPVGKNLKYLIYDRHDRVLACLLFGSSAWALKPRDDYIGWDADERKRHLQYVTNNTRLLVLPGVRVSCLVSHVFSLVVRRISKDWVSKYGHPIYLLESFIDTSRYLGTCYKASNWVHVGDTKGRTRNDRYTKIQVPIKNIYLYPLHRSFRLLLRGNA